jgi:hypothetical protein
VAPTPDRRASHWLAAAALLILAAALLRAEGRIWWCECGEPRPWISDVWTRHCSQHLADPYTVTHISHGLLFFIVLARAAPRLDIGWRRAALVAAAAFWEVLENSPVIIERYRTETMSLDYLGDSIINSLGDILAAVLGFMLARRIGLVWSLALFAASELALLAVMRDNLTLNVLMLIHPIDAIKVWQTAGHAPM